LKKKQQAETAKLLERAIALVQHRSTARCARGAATIAAARAQTFRCPASARMTEYHTRRYLEAEQFLAQAVDVEPRSADAHFNRGAVLMSLGRFEEARTKLSAGGCLETGSMPTHFTTWRHVCGMPESAG